MEFLGVGPLELVFILIIVLLVVNPKDMVKTARTIGRWLNKLYKSENYQVIQQASRELRHLPQRLAREAQLEELQQEVRSAGDVVPPPSGPPPANPLEAWTRELPAAPPSDPSSPKDKPPA